MWCQAFFRPLVWRWFFFISQWRDASQNPFARSPLQKLFDFLAHTRWSLLSRTNPPNELTQVPVVRDENTAEFFSFSGGKMEPKRKMNWKRKFEQQKWKRNFLSGSGNKNGTAISGGTSTEKELPISMNMKLSVLNMCIWLFYSPTNTMSEMAHV